MIATVGVTGVGTASSDSSSSSSSSMRVWSWSFEEEDWARSLNESRLFTDEKTLPEPENVGLLVGKRSLVGDGMGLKGDSVAESSGIWTLEYETSCFPSKAQRARRRIESFSPRLMLSSEVDGGRSGRDTPINSADSRRVETEERRRWCELGRLGGAEPEPEPEPDMLLKEKERLDMS